MYKKTLTIFHDYFDKDRCSNSNIIKIVDYLEEHYKLYPEDGREISQILFRCNYFSDSPNSVIVGELSPIYYGADNANYIYDEGKINIIHWRLKNIRKKALEAVTVKNKILNLHKKILTDNQIVFEVHPFNGVELDYDHPYCGVVYGERPDE